jgi:serine/threonine protein kinase
LSEDLSRFRRGSRLAGYRLEARIGSGGMAVVWRAHDRLMNRPVALKIMDPKADPTYRRRFFVERRAAAKVDYHPNIITVYNAGEADGVLFIAMQFVKGGDLGRLLKHEGQLSPERAAEFVDPVAWALDAVHGARLVHRDVKPANVLVDTRAGQPDQVYLSDFGIAKAELSAVTLTKPGGVIGSLDYMAPEQLEGRAPDGRADQYALACLAYELLTGAVPYPRDSIDAAVYAHLHDPPPRLTQRRTDLLAAADEVLAKALAKAPGQRYESCGDFADALRDALGVLHYGPRKSAIRLASPRPTATPAELAGAPPALPAIPSGSPTGPPTVTAFTDARPPVSADAPPRKTGHQRAKADELLGVKGSAQAAARPRTARRRRRLWQAGGILSLAVLIAAAAVITASIQTRHAGSGSNAPGSSASTFPGYPGQTGPVTVNSIAGADGTWLAAGSAGHHLAVWRLGTNETWRLVSGNSPKVSTLTGALTGVAHGPQGWIAVGNDSSGPVAVTSGYGMEWRVDSATFLGEGAILKGVAAAGPNGYLVVGTTVNTKSSNSVAAMWSSTDLGSWNHYGNHFAHGEYLDGGQHRSFVAAVAGTQTGTFLAVGQVHQTQGFECAVWTPVPNSAQPWPYSTIPLPSGASSAALTLVAVNDSGFAVAAGNAALEKGGDAPGLGALDPVRGRSVCSVRGDRCIKIRVYRLRAEQ